MGALKREEGRPWRPQLTRRESRMGMVFFVLYLTTFPLVVGGVVRVLDEHMELWLTTAQTNAVYYTLVLLALMAVFWEFLRHALTILKGNLLASLFAFGAGFFIALGATCLLGLIPLPVTNQEIENYKTQFFLSPAATWAVAGLLKPVVEEILYRGLLFGTLRRESRMWAYVLSAGLFALSNLWQHALFSGNPAYLLLIIQYLPLGLVLCWSYDISGSVYTPMALRVALQTMFLIFAAMTPGAVPPMGA